MTPAAAADSIRVGSVVEIEVQRLSSEGAGVGPLPDGRTVFVHRTAPGDRARIEIRRTAPRWARGRLVQLLRPGVDRRDPPCPLYEGCGGCTLQHVPYPAQLEAKGAMVISALRRIGRLPFIPEPELHPSPAEFRYRNRFTFTLVRRRGGRVLAGLHELERAGRIVEVDGRCLLPEAAISGAWAALRRSWGPGANRLPAGGELRLTLRSTLAGEVLLVVVGGRGTGDPQALLAEVPGLVSIWHLPAGSERRVPPRLLAGEPEVSEEWMGERLLLEPGAFLQVHRALAKPLHEAVLESLGEVRGRTMVEAYCGHAGYGRAAARAGARCVGIELDPGAVRMARKPGVEGLRILEGRVGDRLREALPADLVLLNPPRTGVEEGVMDELARARPSRIVYASCDPATLARDLARLGPGFRVDRVMVFDLFPQTSHVETVLTLDRE